ncbi:MULTISPECIES: thiamine pyrophosphate-binding protein [unclassified Pseudomonas]|uniref:thiamine pyrophosphate-binding protein n=1 Tax=unclassified Pseudomonas TaxID=196821 RepID=UPI000C884669|nr:MULTISPECIES: thiamine pyrophosphate-binding protein [unclassified Pseudomonas]PMZ98232.1 thiamine pyrophosphate-binding protein [Pseudomonas sp. FW305-42]PNA22724.1 thiamine pyrophosphate-binding protein [Pseudomonas sp. MPR-R1B]PNB25593.1 thiamine pyrophosphate-binding protein [Pseudomonas sp. DP16D-E2]PNB42747.1 thiamine pyrophosphate-binding protein [Pseudomonas sp. FW305-17]PNB59150.1 thiamine pyrophosphate-binding protein [Pseudomonas sp. GW531-E2]
MRVADYIFQFIADQGIGHVFFLPGGGAMHLNNALLRQPRLSAVSMLHEQGAAIAAEGYARTSGRFGACLVTSGPGATNAITGLAGGWFESTPMFFVSGQVKRADLKGETGLRQLGTQELDIVSVVSPLSKYAVCLLDPLRVRYELEKAAYLMLNGRKGPVWLDVPLDVQATEIDPGQLEGFEPPEDDAHLPDAAALQRLAQRLKEAQRPVLLVGNGVHCASAETSLRQLVEQLGIPTLTTWIGADLLEFDHPLYFGRCGTVAARGANFTVQNADLVLAIGCRMDFSITGFNRAHFARAADIVVVDIDAAEIDKLGDMPDERFVCDAKAFIDGLSQATAQGDHAYPAWIERCTAWKHSYPVVLPEYRKPSPYVNTYVFAETLSAAMAEGDQIIPGSSGAALDTFWLAVRLKRGQRAVATGGLGSMGYGLPASIGGCLGSGRRRTISVDGDGGFVMNIQELEVVRRLRLPIKYFILNNNGYASIRASQGGYFKETIGCDPDSGLTLPDISALAAAFGLATVRITGEDDLRASLDKVLAQEGPVLCELMVEPDQAIGPRVTSRIGQNGAMVSRPLEDLFPFLEPEELQANMLIPLVEQ